MKYSVIITSIITSVIMLPVKRVYEWKGRVWHYLWEVRKTAAEVFRCFATRYLFSQDMALCHWVIGAQHFKTGWCSHIQGSKCPMKNSSLDQLPSDLEPYPRRIETSNALMKILKPHMWHYLLVIWDMVYVYYSITNTQTKSGGEVLHIQS